jgi:hypothetical protein
MKNSFLKEVPPYALDVIYIIIDGLLRRNRCEEVSWIILDYTKVIDKNLSIGLAYLTASLPVKENFYVKPARELLKKQLMTVYNEPGLYSGL